ncbi:MAG: PKD domain-containing protein [Bacteroidia bacterium]
MRCLTGFKYFLILIISFFSGRIAFAQVTTATFNCTGAPQNYTIPPCVTTVTVEAWGAGGGGGGVDSYTGSPGGGGAYAYATLAVAPGQVLTVYVGCGGLQGGACQGNGPGGAGGYGYGSGGNGGNSGPNGCSGPGGGGGGGSAVLNGATVLVVAGGGGGGGGGGNYGDGGNGGGGGQNGFSQSSPGGILGASGTANGLPGASTAGDGAGGGGGGGGVNGGGGGQVPGTDYGGSGGAGGTSVGTMTLAANGQTPGNAGSPYLCSGCAVGGAGGAGAPGVPGDVVISYSTPPALTSNIASTPGCTSATATITPTSGTGPYTYTWSPSGGNAATASGLTNGPYTVNFTDSKGCTGTNNITITLPSAVTGTVTTGPGLCGVASGTVSASGGTPGYTYTWSPTGGNAATTNSLVNGSYTVTIKDAMGCTGTATTSIVLPPALTITAAHSNVTCNGLSDATATATASGGSPSYTLAINTTPPQFTMGSTFNVSGLAAGTYTFGMQDSNGCQDTVSFTVTQPAVLQQTVTPTSPICVGASSVLSDAVSGGTAPYNVTWSSGGSGSGAVVTTTVSPVTTTTYSATVTDFNNCTNTSTATVVVNALPAVMVNSATICVGNSTTLTAGGASTYSWNSGTGLSATSGASVTANPVTTTVYTVTGTDANNCVNTATSTVNVNPTPTVTVASATICIGSTATLTANGASSYTWSPSTGLSVTTGSSVNASPATTTVYTISGTDANTCTNTTTATVTVNTLPVITIGSNSPVCENQTLNLTSGGGTGYSWNGPNSFSSASQNPSIATASPAASGVYTVTVTDANTCVNTATVSAVINALPTITANSATICVGGSANLNTNGANTYTWSPGTGLNTTNGPAVTANPGSTTPYTITGTDGNNCINTGTATVTVNNLPVVNVASATICIGGQTTLTATGANTYTWFPGTGLSSTTGSTVTANPVTTTDYTITGDNGCTGTTTATVTVNSLPAITASSATICPGIPGTLTANGSSLTYTWSNGATSPTVTLTPGSTTTYTVTGTDVNTCTNTATGTIVVNPALVLSVSSNAPVCAGSTVTFSLTSNPQSVTWQWNGPNGFSSNAQNPSLTNAQVNMSGTYSVGAVDINGCLDTAFINITINPLPTPTASNSTPICENQNQSINFSGFNLAGGTYVWTGPNGYNVTAQNPSISNAQSGASGIYTLTVTDGNNCSGSDTTLVIVYPNPPLTINSPTTCITTPVGIWVNGSNTYTWTPGTDLDTTTGANVIFTPLTAGSYTFSVTGTNLTGCQSTTVTVINAYPISGVTVHSATLCAGNSTPLIASGASTYTWTPSTGLSSNTGSLVIANPASTTIYTVTGKNSYGCAQIVPDTVVVNPRPALVLTPITATGCEPLCVAFSNTANAPGNYNWNFGDGNNDNTPAPTHCFAAGNFTTAVQVTDANGCTSTATATIVAYPKPIANFLASPQPTTIFDPEIHFLDGTSGGATIATWNWLFGDGKGTSSDQNPIYYYKDTGTYAVMLTVVSDRGCRDSIIIDVRIDDEYLIYVPSAFTPNHDGMNDVFMPKGEGVTEYKLYVYDRWGQLAFKSNDLSVGWDGRHLNKGNEIAPEDIYIWKIEAKNQKGEPKMLKGHVSLLK